MFTDASQYLIVLMQFIDFTIEGITLIAAKLNNPRITNISPVVSLFWNKIKKVILKITIVASSKNILGNKIKNL